MVFCGSTFVAGADVRYSRIGIEIGALLVGRSLAPSVAAVVEDEDVDPKPLDQLTYVADAVADVAPVAVEPDQCHIASARDEPPVQRDSVRRLKPNVLELETDIAGRCLYLSAGEVDE